MVDGILAMVDQLALRQPELRCPPVVLSGGTLQNASLMRALRIKLARRGWEVLTHHMLPPGDGGLSAGQAVVAAAISAGSSSPCV